MKGTKWQIFFLLAIIGGSSFILIKRSLEGLSPIELGGVRVLAAALVILMFNVKKIFTIPKEKFKYILVAALCGVFFPAFLFAYAQTQIDSIVSAIINATTPLLTFVIGALCFGLISQRRQFFGVIIGFLGCALLIFEGANLQAEQNYWYSIYAIIACICYAININWVKKYLSDISPMQIAVGSFTILFFLSIGVLVTTDLPNRISEPHTQETLMYAVLLGATSTGLGNYLFYKLIQISSPVFASSTTYLLPLVAFVWGVLDGEKVFLMQLVGAVIILIGVRYSSRKN
ncbi:MAG: DMT family transporter [Bacteroidota bacterium]|nr:DMT family transporter [Bacteroidota bacterium]